MTGSRTPSTRTTSIKKLGKCFIRIRSTDKLKGGEIDNDDRIYDALEHVEQMELFESIPGSGVFTIHGKASRPLTPEDRAQMDLLMEQ